MTLRLNDSVLAVDAERKVVRSARYREVPYDKLVLATGSYPFVPPVPGRDRRDCFVYRTIEDLEVIAGKAKGARVQRPLWASTSTKDKTLPDVYYVEALIAPDSVNTMPPETFEAYRDHGDPKVRIHDDLDGAHAALSALSDLKIDFRVVTQELEDEGVKKFADSYDGLLQAIVEKEKSMRVA